jgi:AcrR family transcriptional regulator
MSEPFDNTEHELTKNLTMPQLRAVQLFLSGKRITHISAEIGYSRAQIYHWFKKPEIKALIRAAWAGQLADLANAAMRSADAAMDLLGDTVKDNAAPLALRLRAAERLMTASMQLRADVEDDDRLDELETMVRELQEKARVY